MGISPVEMEKVLGHEPNVVAIGKESNIAPLCAILQEEGFTIKRMMRDSDEASYVLEREGINPDGIIVERSSILDQGGEEALKGLSGQSEVVICNFLENGGLNVSTEEKKFDLFSFPEYLAEKILNKFTSLTPQISIQAS